MSNGSILPFRICCSWLEQTRVISGCLPPEEFTRFPRDISLEENVSLELECLLDGDDLTVTLEVIGTFSATCQRCLKKLKFTEKLESAGKIVTDVMEPKIDLDPDFEYVYCPEGELDLVKFVEDEFLLALPMVPKHEDEQCGIRKVNTNPSDSDRKNRPFAMLKDIFVENGPED